MTITRLLCFGRLVGVMLAVSGCAGVPVVAEVATVQGMALNHTDKIASDHFISLVTGQDCNILTYKKIGKYCRSAAEINAERAKIAKQDFGHCYRTRGLVTCYRQPEILATGETQTN